MNGEFLGGYYTAKQMDALIEALEEKFGTDCNSLQPDHVRLITGISNGSSSTERIKKREIKI